MLTPDLLAYVRAALPPTPARVLEVGAGRGELAAALGAAGYDVLAIDPAGHVPEVRRVALGDLDGPDASFDAAVAVLSLHHVDPLEDSCRRLGALVRPGGALVLDELDVARLDERAAGWWLAQHRALGGEEHGDAAALLADMHGHLHPVDRLRAALAPDFELGEPVRGPYLHRWELHPELRGLEVELIASGRLPAVGARLVGVRL